MPVLVKGVPLENRIWVLACGFVVGVGLENGANTVTWECPDSATKPHTPLLNAFE
jgi:hypothetical protein